MGERRVARLLGEHAREVGRLYAAFARLHPFEVEIDVDNAPPWSDELEAEWRELVRPELERFGRERAALWAEMHPDRALPTWMQ